MKSRLLLFLFLSLGLVATGCPSSDDDDSAVANDDDAADDDDAVDDDDSVGDDDDATGAPISCDGTLPVVAEVEPNDKAPQALTADGAGFCIEGTVTCGDEQYLDNDLYVFQLTEGRNVTVTLEWTGESDADSYLYVGEISETPLINYEEGFSSPESGTADVVPDEDYLLQVACWDGQDTPYTLTVEYQEIVGGDDDDSAGDDDDSVGDDDDSVGDDDDSAVGDDDDSAVGDDDDSAVGDDDDSAVGDDDDSAVTCVTEILGNSIDDDCDGQTDEYTFSDVYSLVLSPNCSCHSGSSHSTGWFFNGNQAIAYTNLVNAAAAQASLDRIEPSDAANSYLWHKINGTQASVGGSGGQMPLGGSPLSAAHLTGIQGWINSGAAND